MHGIMGTKPNVPITPHVLELIHTPPVYLLTSVLFKVLNDYLTTMVDSAKYLMERIELMIFRHTQCCKVIFLARGAKVAVKK